MTDSAFWQQILDHNHRIWTHPRSQLHGGAHWRCVALRGLELLQTLHVPQVPPAEQRHLVLLFALFHDICRENDGADRRHGSRAARRLIELGAEALHLPEPGFSHLVQACQHHTAGRVSEVPIVGVCWDADRLDLWRAGYEPMPRLLSTPPARRAEIIHGARKRVGHNWPWERIFSAFSRGGVPAPDDA